LPSLDPSLIRALHLFAGLTDQDLVEILRPAASKRHAPGQAVFEQGAPAREFFVLLHGRLRVTQVTPDGQQLIVRMVNPGDLFGIAKALQRSDYPGTASAVSESVVLGWPMTEWDSLLARYPQLAIGAMRTVGGRLQEAQSRIREMTTEVVERRVGHTVLRLAKQSGVRKPDGIHIDFPVSKQDLAEMTGTTLFTVSRILSAWEDAGIVIAGRQKLTVSDPHRLLLIADGVEAGLLS
jgi:CRP-like cAMP-binding protein